MDNQSGVDGENGKSVVSRDDVIAVLRTIEDPELFLDIWFLGLIYSIEIDGSEIAIQMTFTSPTCPAGPHLIHEVQTNVAELPGVTKVDVVITFEPQWEPSDEVKGLLGML